MSSRGRHVFAKALLVAASLCSLHCVDDAPLRVPVEEPAAVALDTRRTTNPDIAVGNLNAAIETLRVRVARQPDDLELSSALADQLLARTVFLGSYDDFQEVDALSAGAYARHPGVTAAILMRAGYLSAVHRFTEAQQLLAEAESAGAESREVERGRIVLDLALGSDPGPLLARARALVSASDSYAHLTVLASVLEAAGRYQEADATYLLALERYRDVSPFALAWVSFARGAMWGEAAGRPDLALVLYQDAVRRLPQYVVANVHLSELEQPADAIARLGAIAETVGDPEPAGRLSERVAEHDPGRAQALRAQSEARYNELLARHRAAFLDHGAEFFAGAGGDPARGLAMALENIALRPVPRAYVVAIEAALAARDEATACRLVAESTPLHQRHRVLANQAHDLQRSCR